MTRPQQEATRALERVLAEWLRSHGWRQNGRLWVRPSEPSGVSLWDAFMMTRATPLQVTRSQHEATRASQQAIAEWLKAYGWREDGRAWVHAAAQQAGASLHLWDAFMMTRAAPLRFGAAR